MYDPRRPSLRYRLDKGDTLGVAWLALGSVALCELAARARPDAIVLDLQHGLWERASMEHAIAAVPSDIPVLVRVAENTPLAIGQALDAGAEGVIVPLVETAKQARAAVEGVDMVFIGTGDLALSLGTFPNADARHEAACAAVRAACRAEWTLCGTFTGSTDAARARREQGYRMVVTVNDIDLVAKGFAQATTAFGARTAAAPPLPVSAPAAPNLPAAGAAQGHEGGGKP
jgi:2-keto-3-deoxy-L-rhamnonate aldolase RhmA